MSAILLPELGLDPAYEPRGVRIGRNVFPAPADKTSDEGDRDYLQRMAEARARHWRDLDANTVGDVANDEDVAEAARRRDPYVLGALLLDLLNERIECCARRSA